MTSPHPAVEGSSHPSDSLEVTSHDASEPTTPGKQGEFSLENTMREMLKRLALEPPPISAVIHHPSGWKTQASPQGPSESTSRTCA